jgi:hypothetical protein
VNESSDIEDVRVVYREGVLQILGYKGLASEFSLITIRTTPSTALAGKVGFLGSAPTRLSHAIIIPGLNSSQNARSKHSTHLHLSTET